MTVEEWADRVFVARNDDLTREITRLKQDLARQVDIIKRLRNALANVGTYLSRAFKHDEWGTKGALEQIDMFVKAERERIVKLIDARVKELENLASLPSVIPGYRARINGRRTEIQSFAAAIRKGVEG